MSRVVIRRNGNVIDVSQETPEGMRPLSENVLSVLKEQLTYTHVRQLRGFEQYMSDGSRRYVETTARQLFHLDVAGALVTGFGALTRVVTTLGQLGVAPMYVDMSPPRLRPNCYQEDWDNLRQHVQFRPGQEECLRLITQNQCGQIDATMGFGKGELFLMLGLLYPHAKFHIVAPGKDIAQSLVRRLSRVFSNVGLIGGGKNYFGTRITVFVSKSMRKSDGDSDFLLCDELHLMAAPSYSYDIAFVWKHSRNFGFSGTVDMRLDKADRELELLFGVPLFKMSYQEAQSQGLVVPITVRWLPIQMEVNPCSGMDGVRMMRHGIWTNSARNEAIAEDIRRHYSNPETQILVLCQSVEHAVHLWNALPDFELCYGTISPQQIATYKRMGLLPETFTPMSAKHREELRQGFADGRVKRVIATDVWATGVDFVNLAVLYRTDARASEIIDNQGPGRLSRTAAGKNGAVLVDCWDLFDSRFTRRSAQRKAHYKKLGWHQTNMATRGRLDETPSY